MKYTLKYTKFCAEPVRVDVSKKVFKQTLKQAKSGEVECIGHSKWWRDGVKEEEILYIRAK